MFSFHFFITFVMSKQDGYTISRNNTHIIIMKKLFVIFCLLYSISVYSSNINGGLFFRSHQQPGTIRTRLVLNGGKPIKIENGRTISFDLMLRKEIVWGYVVRIITNTQKNIDLVYLANKKNDRYPAWILNESQHPITQDLTYNKWIPISVKLMPKDNKITFSFGSIQSTQSFDFSGCKNVTIHFGTSGIKNFQVGDVAPINIKNVRVLDNKDNEIYHWELKQHADSICYDLIKQCPAITENPIWLIDNHSSWDQLYKQKIKGNPQITYNSDKNLFYIINGSNQLTVLNPITQKSYSIDNIKGKLASEKNNQITYDPYNHRLISYSLDQKSISVFSSENNSWSGTFTNGMDPAYIHHTVAISPKDTSLITFGGYGYYLYKNTLFKVNLNTHRWDSLQIKEISPRFSAVSTIVNNTLYIFGGKGSKNGRQEEVSHNLYDLYAVDLATFGIKKIWEIKSNIGDETDLLLRGNMIYSPTDSCFYAINVSKSQGYLVRISLNRPEIKRCSTNIGDMSAGYLFCNLYYSPDSIKLYTIFNREIRNSDPEVSIYSIDFPPIALKDTIQKTPSKNKLWVGVIIFLIFLSGYGLYKFSRRKKDKKPVSIEIKEKETAPQEEIKKTFDRSKSSISLLGGFNVKDKEGGDITNQFTPILKSLLLIILLYSVKTKQGISSNKLDSILWEDKDEKSARNNRNVSIRKLRVLLEKGGDIQVVFENNFWKITFGNEVFCDYVAAIQFIQDTSFDDFTKEATLYQLLELLVFGPLLPNTQADWIDNFKSDYSDITLDLLHSLLQKKEFEDKEDIQLLIADTIFLHDIFNEEALRVKCSILYKKDKRSIAKNTYDNFCKQYKSLLGTDYKISFSTIVTSKTTS